MAEQQDFMGKLQRSIGPAFNRAAPDHLRWAIEAAHFERQIRECKTKINGVYQHVLLQGIEAGVEETIQSCRSAARQIASMGLTCNPVAKQVYFIPRRARERRDHEPWSEYAKVPWLVDPTPSYMGLCYIGTHYAGAKVFGASEVYAGDACDLGGPFELPRHRPTTNVEQRTETLAIGVYASVIMADGLVRTEYVDAPTVQRIRGLSKMADSLMYTTVWTEGWKKIALRRLCKLVLQTNDRWLAAEDTMAKSDGITFDGETGEPENVPHGTSAAADKGINGLKEKMQTAQERVQEADPPAPAQPTPPALLALPAPSKNPEGSIEWWLDQITPADSLLRMDDIQAAALTARVNQGPDADAFRSAFARRKRELRSAQ